MKLPYIILIDDDEQVLAALQRDIRTAYRNEYKVAATSSATEALDLIKELKLKHESLALIISDQRMPEMEGVALLESANLIFPDTKKILITAYSDIEAVIKAINQVKLHYYLLKPWSPPEEKLYPVVNDLLAEWHTFYKPSPEIIRIIGYQWSPKSHSLKEFLSGNLIPYQWMDVEREPESEKFLASVNADKSKLPILILKDGTYLIDPDLNMLAERIGLHQKASQEMYDVLIIGAGPAGLAASVYGSCEGLKTILIEKNNPGGQASSSARIENYLGFPTGLSGSELTQRALIQTKRFGTEILTPQDVKTIKVENGYKITELKDGSFVRSKTVILATGVAYKKLDIPGLENFTGAGVYYGAAAVEAHACKNESIYIVGGGNSACQAALYMCKFAKEVNIIIRQPHLSKVAANYLVQNIADTPNIKIIPGFEVTACAGNAVLDQITLRNINTLEEINLPAKALFIYIGAKPSTYWMNDLIPFTLIGKYQENPI